MAGRRPKPTALRLVEGNPGKRAINKKEPKPKRVIPSCPAHLDDSGKVAWGRLSVLLDRRGVLTEADSAALERLSEEGLPYISVLTDPTMGGISASFAFMGDVVMAEPKALIGFAGPRVIEQTVREKLPEGFQRSEFLMEKGAIDMIVHRKEMRDTLARLLAKITHQPTPFKTGELVAEEV